MEENPQKKMSEVFTIRSNTNLWFGYRRTSPSVTGWPFSLANKAKTAVPPWSTILFLFFFLFFSSHHLKWLLRDHHQTGQKTVRGDKRALCVTKLHPGGFHRGGSFTFILPLKWLGYTKHWLRHYTMSTKFSRPSCFPLWAEEKRGAPTGLAF